MKGEATKKANTEVKSSEWKEQYSYDMSNYLLDAVRKLRGEIHVMKTEEDEQRKRLKLMAVSNAAMALAILIFIFR